MTEGPRVSEAKRVEADIAAGSGTSSVSGAGAEEQEMAVYYDNSYDTARQIVRRRNGGSSGPGSAASAGRYLSGSAIPMNNMHHIHHLNPPVRDTGKGKAYSCCFTREEAYDVSPDREAAYYGGNARNAVYYHQSSDSSGRRGGGVIYEKSYKSYEDDEGCTTHKGKGGVFICTLL